MWEQDLPPGSWGLTREARLAIGPDVSSLGGVRALHETNMAPCGLVWVLLSQTGAACQEEQAVVKAPSQRAEALMSWSRKSSELTQKERGTVT